MKTEFFLQFVEINFLFYFFFFISFLVYTTYCADQEKAFLTFKRMQESKSAFRAFLKEVKANTKSRKLPLDSFLMSKKKIEPERERENDTLKKQRKQYRKEKCKNIHKKI